MVAKILPLGGSREVSENESVSLQSVLHRLVSSCLYESSFVLNCNLKVSPGSVRNSCLGEED
jgi:hypothetical protein